jgi:hypothetical protein
MLWVSCCAVYLLLVRETTSETTDWRRLIVLLLHALSHGMALAGLLLVVLRWWRGQRWPLEPGLWLLATFGAVALVRIVLGLIPRDVFHQDEVVLTALSCCLLVAPALARRTPAVWKTAFCALAVVIVVPLLVTVAADAFFGGESATSLRINHAAQLARLPISVLIVAAAVVTDAFMRKRRIWAHWVGLADFVLILALPSAGLSF